ncbi:MAG: alkaline phosphatase family protein [Candidatus Bathyarchaeia archaeon]
MWLDAFSDQYIHPKMCPFIYHSSKYDSFARIKPLFAYEGIKFCIDTGLPINVHKMWIEHTFEPSRYRKPVSTTMFKKLLKLIDRLSPNDEVNKISRYFWFKINRIRYGTPHLIPACLLDFFPSLEKTCEYKSLYQILAEHNIRYVWKEPKLGVEEPSLIGSIPRLLKRYDVVFAKLNSLDRLGHKYGPSSYILQRRVRYFDELLQALTKKLRKHDILIVMSEHGMVPVTHHFDLLSFLKEKGLRFGHHYIGFIGATYASFWFEDEKYKNLAKKELNALSIGKFLTSRDKASLGIDKLGNKYGNEIFVVEEHCVIFPEFYHWRQPPKGMHGYAFSKYDMPIFLIHSNTSVSLRKDKIDFTEIMPTILRLFNIPAPPHIKSKSLI